MKSQHIVEVYPIPFAHDGGHEAEYVDGEEVLGYGWCIVHHCLMVCLVLQKRVKVRIFFYILSLFYVLGHFFTFFII